AALAEFGRTYELAPNYRVLYNLGQVQIERQDYAAAIKYFRAYLDQGGTDVPADRRAQVESDLDDLVNRVAPINFDVNVAGAEILIDEALIGNAPFVNPVLVNAGVRSVLVRKAGYASVQRRLTVVGGEAARLEIRLARDTDPAAHPEAAPTPAQANHLP